MTQTHGLRAITGTCNYVANGSGRDWFFLGDLGFRKGREGYNNSFDGKRPGMQPVPAPQEVRQQKHLHGSLNGTRKTKEELKRRWQSNVEKNSKVILPKCKSFPQYYETAYSKHGSIP